MKGDRSHLWRGGKTVTTNGYRQVHYKDHPKVDKDGYIPEHRLVMELMIGRYLQDKEVVHHRDKDRLNNSTSNLFLFPDQKSHISFHNYQNFVDSEITEEKFMEVIYND